MRTSYSALETYRLCPKKYEFQEIQRLPAKKSKAALFGTLVHGALKFMFSRDPLFPTLDEVLAHFRENWSALARASQDATAARTDPIAPEEEATYLAAGEQMLKNFYARNAPWNFSVVDLESRFEVLVEDPRRHEAHVLAGRIDRIDKTPDGYEIIDYKTSRRMPSQAAVDSDLQMSIYALGLQKRWPHVKPEQITLSLYFLKHGEKLSTRRSPEATLSTTEEVLGTIAEIQGKLARNERFQPTPGPHCDWCPYKPVCPAWRHLYRQPGIRGQEELDAALKEYFSILKSQRSEQSRLAELKTKIAAYMEAGGYDRVFGEDGYMSRSPQKRFRYDFEKVRAVLEPLGKWEAVLEADEKKLKALLATLPPEIQSQIEAAKVLSGEFTAFTASTRKIHKIPRPPGAVGDGDEAGK